MYLANLMYSGIIYIFCLLKNLFHLSKKYSTIPDKEEYAIIKILLFGRIWARTVRILVENYVTIQARAPVIWCNLP